MTGAGLVQEAIPILDAADLSAARLAARSMSSAIGFDEQAVEEIVLVVSELATNLVKHAKDGTLRLRQTEEAGRTGIQIHSEDQGPGIPNVEQAIADDFSTAGSLGCGLGAVNRHHRDRGRTYRTGGRAPNNDCPREPARKRVEVHGETPRSTDCIRAGEQGKRDCFLCSG